MVINNKKFAFTLAESLICLAIISVIVVGSLKIFTRKHTKPVYNPTHGTYICYERDGKYYSRLNSKSEVEATADGCIFRPTKSANYFVVYAVAGGSAGTSNLGGNPGEFTSFFVTSIADTLYITPGKGGASGTNNGNGLDTYIRNTGFSDEAEILTQVSGGVSSANNILDPKNVITCEAVGLPTLSKVESAYKNGASKVSCAFDGNGSAYTPPKFTASICQTDESKFYQHEVIKNFFEDYIRDTASSYAKTSYSSDKRSSSNPVERWNVSCEEGYCSLSYKEPGYTYSSKTYKTKTHRLYDYYNDIVSDDGGCKASTLNVSAVTFNESDKGRVISRTTTDELFNIYIYLNKSVGGQLNPTKQALISEFTTYIERSGFSNPESIPISYNRTGIDFMGIGSKNEVFKYSGAGGPANGKGLSGAVLIAW